MPFEVSARGKRFMGGTLGQGFGSRAASYEQTAADAATTESKAVFERWRSARELAPPRAGRPTTGGAFPNYLKWVRDEHGNVAFDSAELQTAAPYWLIQEIGTSNTARITNPPGSVSVKSQYGRQIPLSLYWADSEGGEGFRPSRGLATQQLFLRSSLGVDENGNRMVSHRAGRIRKEIKGKHYLRDGGFKGYSVLYDALITDARKSFR